MQNVHVSYSHLFAMQLIPIFPESPRRCSGQMDTALVSEARDCEFKSRLHRLRFYSENAEGSYRNELSNPIGSSDVHVPTVVCISVTSVGVRQKYFISLLA